MPPSLVTCPPLYVVSLAYQAAGQVALAVFDDPRFFEHHVLDRRLEDEASSRLSLSARARRRPRVGAFDPSPARAWRAAREEREREREREGHARARVRHQERERERAFFETRAPKGRGKNCNRLQVPIPRLQT